MANDDYRTPQQAAREVGLAARHETRVERAIRRQAIEEIAAMAESMANGYQETALVHRELSGDKSTPKQQMHWRTAVAFRNKADGAWAVSAAARVIGSREHSNQATEETK